MLPNGALSINSQLALQPARHGTARHGTARPAEAPAVLILADGADFMVFFQPHGSMQMEGSGGENARGWREHAEN